MALSPRLEFRQTQALVMTPQLMQAIKLLQLSNLDLAAYVEGELERNPLLERAAEDEGGDTEPDRPAPEERSEDSPPDWTGEELETSRAAIESNLDTGLDNVFPDDDGAGAKGHSEPDRFTSSQWSNVGPGGRDENEDAFESSVHAEADLRTHLTQQMTLAIGDPVQRLIASRLIDLVDEAGYLIADLAEVAEQLGAPQDDVERVLRILQGFDPTGVCARSLAECLTIQLVERNRFDPAMAALIAHLDLLARRDAAALRRICGVDDDDLAEMIAEIRALHPKPGLAFARGTIQPVVPDVFVHAAPDGSFVVELNSDTLPKVLINQSYLTRVSKTVRSDREKAFLSECLQNATWLTRALDQRARTILKVCSEIVRQQDAFFAHGVRFLKPLNLKNVADAIAMHESTVSRVTANKYMATSRGIYELKYFFTAAIAASDGGTSHSAEAVRHRIKQMIDHENAADVLSDDTIVERLKESGIDIARRTVAKYREAMRIPSSVQRRREKRSVLGLAG